ncbi:2-ketocyclohexanecarboxyl-CoA hydrolase [Rhodococcus opacus PD630]|uniref:enoyl-CoA hydratase-related protein n=1 Tax=Rhodococcus opacus TaxID=37919 RepID=UPI00029CB085|nr:enoyl-CoA hydratase-related protein [Rhodococcus opacus]AHK36096.1 putative enoyl-CoA hydratase paaG [Rhodococcus opacus PD630]EHI43601.1 2-ketocyclohexanecarboxyl-CoA hydrolase [Rhodococcus opacus PD630]UDH01270.1 enoyl-CoA hydratase/isomerase family protein [Rhodococcus opacus PD630]
MGLQEKRKTVETLYATLAAGDRAGVLSLLDAEFVGHGAAGMPLALGGTYHGPEAMYDNFWAGIGRHFRAQAHAASVTELGDGAVLVAGTYRGTARSTGSALEAAFTHRIRFAGDLIAELHQGTDTLAWSNSLQGSLEVIDYSVVDGVATVTLNRPDVKNAINQDVADELYDVAQRVSKDSSVRAVLFAGNGSAFSVGGDIRVFADTAADETPEVLSRMLGSYHAALGLFAALRVPVVTSVHGAAAGGALGMLYISDIVLAAEGTKFAMGFGQIGLTSDGGNSWFLPRLVGSRRAAEMYFEDRVLDALEAADWGLITRVVPADELADQAMSLARRLASGPTGAFGAMRQLFRQSSTTPLMQQLADEAVNVSRSSGSQDAQRAFASFVAKQKPTFEGK